jgi:hypothetical protein
MEPTDFLGIGAAYQLRQHVELLGAVVEFLRDVANNMHEATTAKERLTPGLVSGWVQRIDFLGNQASSSNDEVIGMLLEAKVATPLCNGGLVSRV